jgi:hypothetical protein
MCNIFDVHTTCRAVNEDSSTSLSIQCHTQVELFFNKDLFNNVHTITRESSITRLFSYKSLTAHLIGDLLYLLSSLDNVNTTFEVVLLEVAEATTTAENLSFYDILHLLLHSELFSNEESFLSVECNISQGDGNSVLVEETTSLVLMELQTSQR